jgi:hypothetical protein
MPRQPQETVGDRVPAALPGATHHSSPTEHLDALNRLLRDFLA